MCVDLNIFKQKYKIIKNKRREESDINQNLNNAESLCWLQLIKNDKRCSYSNVIIKSGILCLCQIFFYLNGNVKQSISEVQIGEKNKHMQQQLHKVKNVISSNQGKKQQKINGWS